MHRKKCLLPNIGIVKAMLSVLAGTLLFTGCSKLAEYGKSNSNSNTPPQQAATPALSDQPDTSSSTAPTGAPAIPAGPALATSDGDKPGIRVEVVELKRTSGNTANLKFAMINDSDKDMEFSYEFGEGSTSDYGTVAGTHLIDAEGKKKYFVVRDTEGACACSRGLKSIKPKTRTNLWAKFPAPPDDVQKITVVIPHFTPMDDVPISR
jgi:hypothetical protein